MATQNTQRPTASYVCSQAELYSGLNSAWDSQAEREAEFIAENTKYTAGLSVTKKAAIQAAKVLPDGQARYAESEVLRIQMEEKWDTCLSKWNSLDGYVRMAFKGAYYKPRIEEAGKGYYETAANEDWEDLSQLMEAGKTFIATHSATLIADGGMPAGFAASYDTEKDAFETLYGNFKDARQDAQEQTDAKIEANNAIYKEGREMMEDGKHIFRKNPSVRERFVWDRILEMITPTTSSGPSPSEFSIMGTVTDSATGLPVSGAAVLTQSPEVIVLTNAQGKYLVPVRPAGTYNMHIHKDGYAEQDLPDVEVTAGEITTVDFELEAAPVVFEGDVASGAINEHDLSIFTTTPGSTVKVEISGNEVVLSASDVPGPALGPNSWHVFPGTQNKTYDSFKALVGADGTRTHLKIQCTGPFAAHYKITFNNVIVH